MAVWTVVKYAFAVLLVVSGSLCFVAASNLRADIPQGEYRYEVTELNETEVPSRITEPNGTETPYASESQNRDLHFSNLSSSAQTIFLNTLDSGDTYTTDTHPDDFQLALDTRRRTYVSYQNSTYELFVYDIRAEQFFSQIFFGIPIAVGAGLTVLGGGALLWWNRRYLQKQLPF